MKRLLIELDNDLAKELAKSKNMSETVREALRIYIEHIDSNKLQGLQTAYKIIGRRLEEIESKVDFIASKVQ